MKEQIKNHLLNLQDKQYQSFQKKLCPSKYSIIGIRMPILKNYAKELAKNYQVKTLIEQIDNEYYEEIMLKGLLIGLEKDFFVTKQLIYDFVPKIDNWGICDTFCSSLKIIKKHQDEMWEIINHFLKSNQEFEIRFAIVMILDYAIKEEELAKIFKIFENIKEDKYYINMAIAWTLSICLIKHYDITYNYLQKANLNRFTYNKTISKAVDSYRLTIEQKNQLKKLLK